MISAMAKKPTKITTPEPTEAEISAVAASKKKARAERCWAEVQAVLQHHRCGIVGVAEIAGSAVSTGVRIVPQD
jgi:hypothetical protein